MVDVRNAVEQSLRELLPFDGNHKIDGSRSLTDIGIDSLDMFQLTLDLEDRLRLAPGAMEPLLEASLRSTTLDELCQQVGVLVSGGKA